MTTTTMEVWRRDADAWILEDTVRHDSYQTCLSVATQIADQVWYNGGHPSQVEHVRFEGPPVIVYRNGLDGKWWNADGRRTPERVR